MKIKRHIGKALVFIAILSYALAFIEWARNPELTSIQALVEYYPNWLIGIVFFTFGIYLDTKK